MEKQSTELPSSRLFETEIMECSTGREEQLQKHVPVDVWQRPLIAKVSARRSLEKIGLKDSDIFHAKTCLLQLTFLDRQTCLRIPSIRLLGLNFNNKLTLFYVT